jgi:hypothetical protein
MSTDTEVIATFRCRHEAEIAQQLLAAHDIFSMVSADDAGGWQPFIMADVRLMVRTADAQRAREVLAEHEVS